MYFDTFERTEMEFVVKSLQIKDLHEKMERDRSLKAQIFYLFYFVVVVASALFLINWITGTLVALFFVMVIFSKKVTVEQAEKEYYRITESWWKEVEDLDGDMDDRRLFCQIVYAFLSGSHDQMSLLAQEAAQSHALSKLAFIKKLQRQILKR